MNGDATSPLHERHVAIEWLCLATLSAGVCVFLFVAGRGVVWSLDGEWDWSIAHGLFAALLGTFLIRLLLRMLRERRNGQALHYLRFWWMVAYRYCWPVAGWYVIWVMVSQEDPDTLLGSVAFAGTSVLLTDRYARAIPLTEEEKSRDHH